MPKPYTDRTPNPGFIDDDLTIVSVDNWGELRACLDAYDETWIFRGQSDFRYTLSSSLERATGSSDIKVSAVYALNAFKGRAFQYLSNLPEPDERLEWLALMQHHGAPTRLLDWSSSPYVGLFFALEALDSVNGAALWAIDRSAIKRAAVDKLRDLDPDEYKTLTYKQNFADRHFFNRVFDAGVHLVAPVKPFRVNQRLSSQKGLFLVPAKLNAPFAQNILGLQGFLDTRKVIHKIRLPLELRLDALLQLDRMNVNLATLFPGLDGFSRSLRTNLELLAKLDSRSALPEELL